MGDDLQQTDRLTSTAEVDDFVTDFLQGRDCPHSDIGDVGKVPRLVSVTKEFNGLTGIDPLNETENAHVGPTGWSIDRKVPANGHVDSVQVMVGKRHCFGGFF